MAAGSAQSMGDMGHKAITPEKSRLIQLDILRGIAILLVIGRHVHLQPHRSGALQSVTGYWFEIGWTGVDLFFVLSGFLVGGLLFKEWKLQSSLDIKRFLIRRGYKIWPPYVIYLVFATAWLITTGVYSSASRALLAMSPNFLHLQSYVLTPVPHTWSLAIEEHFYLALPFILLYAVTYRASRWKPLLLLPAIGVALAAVFFGVRLALQHYLPSEALPPEMKSFLLPYLNPLFLLCFGAQLLALAALFLFAPYLSKSDSPSPVSMPVIAGGVMALCLLFRISTSWLSPQLNTDWTFTFFATHLRIDSLFFGVLLAYFYHFNPGVLERIGKRRLLLLIAGGAMVAWPVLNPIPGPLSQSVFTLLYLGYGCLLLAFLYTNPGEGLGGRILQSFPARTLAFIGYYSYSIYLWHVNPARFLAEKWLVEKLTPLMSVEALWLVVTTVYVVAVVLIGVVMAKLIEAPSLKLRDRLFPPRADALSWNVKAEVGERAVSEAASI
jgi:peptidoglycan/LPS O-acetylase OafA/YrhL